MKNQPTTDLNRRRVLATAAWAGPAVMLASASPAFANSGTIALIPSVTPEVLETLIENSFTPYKPYLGSVGVTDTENMPRCVSTALVNLNISFQATRDGKTVGAGEDMVFTLGGGLVFDTPPPAGVVLNTARTQATVKTDATGRAVLPPFSASASATAGETTVTANFSTKSESILIPVANEPGYCSLGFADPLKTAPTLP